VEVEVPEPAQATPWLPYGIGAIVVAAGAGLVYWWNRRRK
jgi:hypothetical protein